LRKPRRTETIDCLGIGIMPLDLLFSVDTYPRAGSKIDGRGLCIQGGGPVPNVMIALKRMGHSAALITAVADDLVGRLGLEDLGKEGVDHRFVVFKRGSSDTAVGVVETPGGRRTMVLNRIIHLTPRDITPLRYPIPRIVHLDGRDLKACIKLARWGIRVGATITFDIGSVRNDVSPIFPLVDHLVVADSYAFPFTGARSARQAIQRLRRHCPGSIVVTEGIKGSTGFENGAYVRRPAFRVKNVDTTGAGDAFHAGYIYGLLQGFTMSERLKFGSATAAQKCTRMGARAGLPTAAQVARFLKKGPPTYA